MDLPETRYAKSGDVRIAYQVTGNGSFDLVFVPGFVSNLDLVWEHAGWGYRRHRRSHRVTRCWLAGTGEVLVSSARSGDLVCLTENRAITTKVSNSHRKLYTAMISMAALVLDLSTKRKIFCCRLAVIILARSD
jgi:hypothetical protein